MHKIQLPPDILGQIGVRGFATRLCDEAGEIKAVAVPPDLFHEMFEVWANHVFGPARTELTPIEPDAMTTAEVIEHLRSLEARHRGAA